MLWQTRARSESRRRRRTRFAPSRDFACALGRGVSHSGTTLWLHGPGVSCLHTPMWLWCNFTRGLPAGPRWRGDTNWTSEAFKESRPRCIAATGPLCRTLEREERPELSRTARSAVPSSVRRRRRRPRSHSLVRILVDIVNIPLSASCTAPSPAGGASVSGSMTMWHRRRSQRSSYFLQFGPSPELRVGAAVCSINALSGCCRAGFVRTGTRLCTELLPLQRLT